MSSVTILFVMQQTWLWNMVMEVTNMVMEEIEQTALNTYLNPPSLWLRYVDDVYAIMEKSEVEPFHDYFNTISTSIKFTKELEKSGQLAFWT